MIDVSTIGKLGFGCMRFIGRGSDSVDIDAVSKMIDRFLEGGGTYFDTAWAYPNSEKTLRAALVDRHPRDAFQINSKCAAWIKCKGLDDVKRQMDTSLQTLGVDFFDFYMMHNLGGGRTQPFIDFKVWDWLHEMRDQGVVKHIGFSAHCMPDELEHFFNLFPDTELVTLQVNYVDWDNPAYRERENVAIANAHNVPIVVMEPVKGGMLANPPRAVKEILDEAMPGESYATTALRFSASVPGVVCVLSGMSTYEQVDENMHAFEDFKPFGDEEKAVFTKAQKAMVESGIVPCTNCGYCLKVCPANIGIPSSIAGLNYAINFEDNASGFAQMRTLVKFNEGREFPTECTRCGACEAACPQNLPILDCFDRIVAELIPAAQQREPLIMV